MSNYDKSDETFAIRRTHTVAVKFLQLSTAGSSYPRATDKLQANFTAKKYHYLTHDDNIKVNDFAVVMSPIFNAPALVQIVEVMPNYKSDMAFKYLIDVVDFTDYNQRMAAIAAHREWEANQRRRASELEQSLAQHRQRAEQAFIDNYLQADPEYQTLQTELRRIKESL